MLDIVSKYFLRNEGRAASQWRVGRGAEEMLNYSRPVENAGQPLKLDLGINIV